jgi:hypothetical protein
MKPIPYLFVLLAIIAGNLPADVLVTDDFSDGNRTADPAWYISGGSFAVGSGSAFNNNTTLNQFFTTSFTPTDLADDTGFRLTLAYRPDGANLNGLRVGIFQGTPVATDNWAQFTAGQPTRDWEGYYASIGLTNNSATALVFNDSAVDDHAFFSGVPIVTSGTGTNVAGQLAFRSVVFEMTRQGSDMLLAVYEGPDLNNLTTLATATHTGGSFDNFNNVSLFHTTGNGLNGSIRYDDIELSTIVVPEPASVLLLGLGGLLLVSRRAFPRIR